MKSTTNSTPNIITIANFISMFFDNHAVLPKHANTILTLWIIHTYCVTAFQHTPRLIITSPTKGCGKSLILKLISSLCSNGNITVDPTPAAVRTSLEESNSRKTYLFDEVDRWLSEKKEIGTILNSGWDTETAYIEKTEIQGNQHVTIRQRVYSPIALGSIGTQAYDDTLIDRSIIISLEKEKNPQITKYDLHTKASNKPHKDQLEAWCKKNQNQMPHITYSPTNNGDARAVEKWTPLFIIASLISSQWKKRIKEAYKYYMDMQEPDEQTQFLIDLKEIFDNSSNQEIPSNVICKKLHAYEEHPWGEKKITASTLAKLLKDYKIKSKRKTVLGNRTMCYLKKDLEKVFQRYI